MLGLNELFLHPPNPRGEEEASEHEGEGQEPGLLLRIQDLYE